HIALLFMAMQLRTATLTDAPQRPSAVSVVDSVRDLKRGKSAQASFERNRRFQLPIGSASGGRCDVHLGRYCWWYDESGPTFPPEASAIGRWRGELLSELDTLAARHPGDEWLSGMRVHYRVDGRDIAGADSVARACRGTGWWCSALVGYAAHSRGDGVVADSAFASALTAMPTETACAWRSIATLLGDGERDAYEHRTCDERVELERRYWLLSRPQLSAAANEWQNEFNVRRVLVWLGERGATPHLLSWGNDAAELVLRYGWPIAWSRIVTSSQLGAEPSIVGHDPSPSFAFAPARVLSDSMSAIPSDAWEPSLPHAESRYAPRLVRKMAGVAMQVARFRRGDSTLVVAAFTAADDSLVAPIATLGAAGFDGAIQVSQPDSLRTVRTRVLLAGAPFIVGVELADTTTHTLARARTAFVPVTDSVRLGLSDLLFYRADDEPAASLDSALSRAIPGDTVTRNRQLGLFWETYGLSADGESVDVAVSVERVDHSWIRSTRQRLGLTPVDTPIRIKWTDARPPANRAAMHAVSLDLENLDTGRYRVTLTLTPVGGAAVLSSREMTLINP
ncbi:MAG: hypothetical protein ABI969_13480, partial [bacterium]